MTKRTRPRRVKAVATVDYGPGYWDGKEGVYRIPSTPVWFVPRTAAAYDAMVEQGAAAIRSVIDVGNDGADNSIDPPLSEHAMIAVLRSFGITRPKD